MVHGQRLTMMRMIISTSCAITLLNLSTFCIGHPQNANQHHSHNHHYNHLQQRQLVQNQDITQNLIRDPLELGNAYQGPHGLNGQPPNRIKSSHHRRPSSSSTLSTSNTYHESSSVLSPASDNHQSHHQSSTTHKSNHRQSQEESQSREETEECPLCTAARKNAGLDDETLRSLRIEMVKQQILKKLRLTEPPKPGNVSKIPHSALPPLGNPVLSNVLRNEDEDDVANMDMEDFYGKTEHIIVLPQDELTNCSFFSSGNHIRSHEQEPASCFTFNLPKEVRSNQISSAELWVYKLSDNNEEQTEGHSNSNSQNHHFSVSEIITLPNHPRSTSKSRNSFHTSPMASRFDIPTSSSWVNFNITERARKWLIHDSSGRADGAGDHKIKISCSTCSKNATEFPFDVSDQQQPFIVFNIANGKRRRRNRRSLNCNAGMTACCRESLYISFAEIKWDWVVEPKGFDAYYCKGNCYGDAALAHTATRHSGIMLDVVKNQGGINNKTEELVPCCTATEMSSISLIYRDPESANSFPQVTLPNMVVQSCGCK